MTNEICTYIDTYQFVRVTNSTVLIAFSPSSRPMGSQISSRSTKFLVNLSSFWNYGKQRPFTSLDAIRNFAIVSEALYPQHLTWNRSLWRAEPTPNIKMIPWYSLSFILAMSASASLYVAIREILGFQQGPAISVAAGIGGLMQICINSFDVFLAVNMISTVDEYCFMLNHLCTTRRRRDDNNGKWRQI